MITSRGGEVCEECGAVDCDVCHLHDEPLPCEECSRSWDNEDILIMRPWWSYWRNSDQKE